MKRVVFKKICVMALAVLLALSCVSCNFFQDDGGQSSAPTTSVISDESEHAVNSNSDEASSVATETKSEEIASAEKSQQTKSEGSVQSQASTATEESGSASGEITSKSITPGSVLPERGKSTWLAYRLLSSSDQELYDEMLSLFYRYVKTYSFQRRAIGSDVAGHLTSIFSSISADHPELFYVSGFTFTVSGGQVTFRPEYSCNAKEVQSFMSSIEAKTKEWLATAPVNGSDYEKSKWVYEHVIRWTEYDYNVEYNQDFRSLFLSEKTVCAGYAATTTYLLQLLQIPATFVQGKGENESGKVETHAWNLLLLDGEYYWMDTTWGDLYNPEEDDDAVSYCYLNVTDAQMADHTPVGNGFELPACTATADSYFTKEKLHFIRYDRLTLRTAIARQLEKGNLVFCVYYSEEEAYEDLCADLDVTGTLSSILKEAFREVSMDFSKYHMSYIRHDELQILEMIIRKK